MGKENKGSPLGKNASHRTPVGDMMARLDFIQQENKVANNNYHAELCRMKSEVEGLRKANVTVSLSIVWKWY